MVTESNNDLVTKTNEGDNAMYEVVFGNKSEGKMLKTFIKEFSISVLPGSNEIVFFKKPVLLERMREVLSNKMEG